MPEVKEVALGVQDFEVEIAVSLMKISAATVSFDDIINAIRRENSTISAGNVVAMDYVKYSRFRRD